jgi:AraC-like DNA-binding protein
MQSSRPPLDWRSPRLHPTQARLILLLLERFDVPAEPALAGSGWSVSDLQSATQLVPFEVLRRLVLALPPERQAGFGLTLAELAPLTTQGPLGVAMTASADLDEALQSLAEYGGARAHAGRFHYRTDAEFGEMEYLETFDFGDMRLVVLESTALYVCTMVAAVAGRMPDGVVVQFPYAPPPWSDRYANHFPAVIEFYAPALRIRIPRGGLAARCVAADAKAHAAALRECSREAAEIAFAIDREIDALVRDRLAEAGGEYPTLETMAASLALSPRTFIRRLRGRNLRYQDLLDEARAALACWRLAHTADTVEEIAADLGYRDTSNFSRSFRRWRGMTPSQFRSDGSR